MVMVRMPRRMAVTVTMVMRVVVWVSVGVLHKSAGLAAGILARAI